MTLSNECRCAHEHGDVSITRRGESEAQQNHLPPTHSDSIQQIEFFTLLQMNIN